MQSSQRKIEVAAKAPRIAGKKRYPQSVELTSASDRANTKPKKKHYIFSWAASITAFSLSFVSYLQIVIHTETTKYGL